MTTFKATYKGYRGIAKFDRDENSFVGDVILEKDVVTFEGKTVNDTLKAFHESVDYYLSSCKNKGKEPEKP